MPSSSSANMHFPDINLSSDFRSFRIGAPTIWNSFPSCIRSSQTMDSFRKHHKTHLFQSPSTGFASWLRYCTNVTQRRSTKLRIVWPSPALVHYIYIFGGSCPLTEFCQLQNSLCVQILRSPILAAVLHGTGAVGVSQSLQRGTRNGITELSQGSPPIFGRAAITLGMGPHSSYISRES